MLVTQHEKQRLYVAVCWCHTDAVTYRRFFMDTPKTLNEFKAQNILLVAQQHKELCHDEYCNVNLFLLLEEFERYIGRTATEDEFNKFM